VFNSSKEQSFKVGILMQRNTKQNKTKQNQLSIAVYSKGIVFLKLDKKYAKDAGCNACE
jgi:hypothetical protein